MLHYLGLGRLGGHAAAAAAAGGTAAGRTAAGGTTCLVFFAPILIRTLQKMVPLALYKGWGPGGGGGADIIVCACVKDF